ncbi:MAG: hypothetical protein H7Y07_13530, partial [Pyrinomonadaceae bacterium]|nr:hypothetical protein [Sphingobacteriaceae bacterium]
MKKLLLILFLLSMYKCSFATEVEDLIIKGPSTSPHEITAKVSNFIGQELLTYLNTLKQPNTALQTFYGEPLDGSNNNIGIVQALSDYGKLTGVKSIEKYNLDEWIKEYLLREVRKKEIAFAQLFVSQVLLSRSDTKELQTDTFWKTFSS